MSLSHPLFASNARIQSAAQNAPAMRRGEPDEAAVRLLQQALVACGAATMRRSRTPDGGFDGDYGGETHRGVERFQEMHGLTNTRGRGDGIAGRATWAKLDTATPRQASAPYVPGGAVVTSALAGARAAAASAAASGGTSAPPPAETPATVQTPGRVSLPTPDAMLREYRRFRDVQGKPCQRGITNQCAIRMSVALMRCDIGFHFDNPRLEYTHRGGGSCGVDVPHNAGAQRLFDHLETLWSFTRYRKSRSQTASDIHDHLRGRRGIVFFKNCFTRAGQSRKVGDHIDYWDGAHTMNDLLNYNGPGERAADAGINWGRWFTMTERDVYFLPLGS